MFVSLAAIASTYSELCGIVHVRASILLNLATLVCDAHAWIPECIDMS